MRQAQGRNVQARSEPVPACREPLLDVGPTADFITHLPLPLLPLIWAKSKGNENREWLLALELPQ
jgi:hypothetical protein